MGSLFIRGGRGMENWELEKFFDDPLRWIIGEIKAGNLIGLLGRATGVAITVALLWVALSSWIIMARLVTGQ